MPVTTKPTQSLTRDLDVTFAKQLAGMLGGVVTQTPQAVTKQVAVGQVTIDEVMQQANDGISLAQIIDMSMQDAGELLAQLYYHIETAANDLTTNYVELNNQLRQQLDNVSALFASVRFQDQAIFQQPSQRTIPTGLQADGHLTLQIPNVNLNQLGAKTWQLVDGPVLPIRHAQQMQFKFGNLKLKQGQRIRLTIGDADVLEECMANMTDTMQQVAELINQAELEWLNHAILQQDTLLVNAHNLDQAQLSVEQPAVALEDSLASLQINSQQYAQYALQVIIGAINMLADYRDMAVSVANDLHQAVYDLMSAPSHADLNPALAGSVVKDVQHMFEQQPGNAVLAQSPLNVQIED